MGFLGGSVIKNSPATQETQVQPLGWEDPLEKGMETHSRILAWRIPWTEEPGGLQSMVLQSRIPLSNYHFIKLMCHSTALCLSVNLKPWSLMVS